MRGLLKSTTKEEVLGAVGASPPEMNHATPKTPPELERRRTFVTEMKAGLEVVKVTASLVKCILFVCVLRHILFLFDVFYSTRREACNEEKSPERIPLSKLYFSLSLSLSLSL